MTRCEIVYSDPTDDASIRIRAAELHHVGIDSVIPIRLRRIIRSLGDDRDRGKRGKREGGAAIHGKEKLPGEKRSVGSGNPQGGAVAPSSETIRNGYSVFSFSALLTSTMNCMTGFIWSGSASVISSSPLSLSTLIPFPGYSL